MPTFKEFLLDVTNEAKVDWVARDAKAKKDREEEFKNISQELAKHDIQVTHITDNFVHVHGGQEVVQKADKYLKSLFGSKYRATQAGTPMSSAPSVARSVATYKKGTPWAGD